MRVSIFAAMVLTASGLCFTGAGTAHAERDRDPDVYCYEVKGHDWICEDIGDLQAECDTYDPNNKSDVCQDVNKAKIQRTRPKIQVVVPQKRRLKAVQPGHKRFKPARQTRKLRLRTRILRRGARR